jgi:hypothetical protein
MAARNARRVESGEAASGGACRECRFRYDLRTALGEERVKLLRWWLCRFGDSELADIARGLGVEGASAEHVAAHRARLLPRT